MEWPEALAAIYGRTKARYMIKAAMVAAVLLSRQTGGHVFTDRVAQAARDEFGDVGLIKILHRYYLNERGKSCR